jgi:putative addiction module component (TIGR02574 family)
MNSNLKQLPVDERIQLVEDIWDSIASDQDSLPLTSEQRVELDKRLDAYEESKDPGKSLDKAISGIRQRL